MLIRIVDCQCGKKFYAVPFFSYKKNCPSCKRPLTMDSGGQLLSDGKPCTSTAHPFKDLHYFFREFPQLNESVYLICNDYSISEIRWGLMVSSSFNYTSLLRTYLGWMRI